MRLQVPLLENALRVNKRLMFFLLSHSKTIEKQIAFYLVFSGKKYTHDHKKSMSINTVVLLESYVYKTK